MWWTAFGAIAQAAGAIATFAAVAVSLWIALSDRRPKLRVVAGLRLHIADGVAVEDLIAIVVENVGNRTVQISNIGWRAGWSRWGPDWMRYSNAVQTTSPGSPTPPLPIAVGDRAMFFVTVPHFLNAEGGKRAEFFGRKLPWRRQVMPANVKAMVCVVGASRDFFYPVEVKLAKFMVSGELDYGAAHFNAAADAV